MAELFERCKTVKDAKKSLKWLRLYQPNLKSFRRGCCVFIDYDSIIGD